MPPVYPPSTYQTSLINQTMRRAGNTSALDLFELEIDECSQATVSVASLARTTGRHKQLQADVDEALKALRTATSHPPVVHQVAVLLQLQGYNAFVRRATGPKGIDGCLRTLRHAFIVVTDLGSSQDTIVDIAFREHFLLASSTPDFDNFLQAIPPVFIGTMGVLQPIVTTACAAMATTYRTLGISVPPWRTTSALMTKFQPMHFVDEACDFGGEASVSSASTTVAGSPGAVISPCTEPPAALTLLARCAQDD